MPRKKRKKFNASTIKSAVTKYFLQNPKKRMNAGQLSKKLKIKANRDVYQAILTQLKDEDLLRQVSEFKYVLNKKFKGQLTKDNLTGKNTYTGVVDSIKSGAAYILVDNLEDDVYVPARSLKSAINGDLVEIIVNKSKGRKPEGKVKKVLKRNTSLIMGEVIKVKKSHAILKPLTANLSYPVYFKPNNKNKSKEGDRLLVEISSWPESISEPIWAKVKKSYTGVSDHNWSMESILIENGFLPFHNSKSMKEAESFTLEITQDELDKRKDFREILTFTIDPDTAQDFDDAISYQVLEDGSFEIGVHIADVTHFLKPGTALDKEAFERSTSVYLVDRCVPMLPEVLSNNLCSLMPNVDRLVFSAVFTFDKKHKLVSEWFGKSIIHSDKRFTYDQAQVSIEKKSGLYHKELTNINKIAKKLRKDKFANGAINFESDEVKFELDENMVPVGVYVKERKDAHLLIEDFMLLANKRVAHYISLKSAEQEIPFVYRVHDFPDLDKVAELSEFCAEFGVEIDGSSPEAVAKSYNDLAKKAKTDDTYKLLMNLAIRTMAKAAYSSNNIGHYGLRFEHYSHFTSPIRRYSDVLTHRILFKNLAGQTKRVDKNKLEADCIHISTQERKAMKAERASIKYKQVEFISKHIGETFEGIISGMIERGIFIELSESKAEGMIPFDRFATHLNFKNRYKAVSRNGKKELKMGDKINVKVLSVDMKNKLIELEPLEY